MFHFCFILMFHVLCPLRIQYLQNLLYFLNYLIKRTTLFSNAKTLFTSFIFALKSCDKKFISIFWNISLFFISLQQSLYMTLISSKLSILILSLVIKKNRAHFSSSIKFQTSTKYEYIVSSTAKKRGFYARTYH